MSKELPHASLHCSDCGTTFRVTLKKGRLPSRPVPCPKCKTPITVTEGDLEDPGERRTRIKTKPGDVLRETKLARVQNDDVAALMQDPPTAEVPVDPPTAEVDVDPRDIDDAASDPPPPFGIISKRRIGGKSAASPERKETPLGVDVAKPTGRGRRDNVFGQRTSNSIAIGRIATRQVNSLTKHVDPDDPDLPASPHDMPTVHAEEQSPKKLDLSKLRKVMAKLEVEQDDDEQFNTPLDDFDLNIDDDVKDLISEASDAIESEFSLISDAVDDQDESSEPEPELPVESESDDEPEAEPEAEAEAEPSEPSEPEAEAELSEPEEEAEPSEPEADAQPSEPREEAEPSEPEADAQQAEPEPEDEAEAEHDEASEPIEVEPEGGTLDVEESEAYELGEAVVPARIPDAPRDRGRIGGILVGVVVLVVFLALFYIMAT